MRLPTKNLPPGIATYKPLRKRWRTSKHHWCYGWPITEGMVQDYLTKQGIPVPDNPIRVNTAAIYDLQGCSGYQHINFVNGKPDSPEALSTGRLTDTDTEHGVALDLLVIGCTSSRRIYLRRPTPKQLEVLTELLGEEPRWFETRHTKAIFSEDVLE